MSRINCETTEDLIPLYVDKVLSKSSVELVEEHLAECEKCTRKVNALTGDTVIKSYDDKRPLTQIKRHVFKHKLAVCVITLSVILVLCGIHVWLNYLTTVLHDYPYDEVKDNLKMVSASDTSAFDGGMKAMLIYDGDNKKFTAKSLLSVVGQKDGKTQCEITLYMEHSAYDDINLFYPVDPKLDDVVFMDEYVSWYDDLGNPAAPDWLYNLHNAGSWDNYESISIENPEIVRLYYGKWETYTASANDRWHARLTGERHLLWAKAGYEE